MRYFTAGNFFFALLMFFLPWLDVRCNAGKEVGTISWVTQSGLQAATGTSSTSSNKGMGGNDQEAKNRADKAASGENMTAPLLWVYFLALAAGGVICLIAPIKPWRAIALGCVVVAVLVLGIQTAIGFPVEREVAKINEESKALKAAGGMNEQNKKVVKDQLKLDVGGEFFVSKMFGYYFAWVFALTPLIFITLGGAKKAPKYGQRYRRDRDDDYDDDEPVRGERGRSRRDDRDDEDEEPRPRRRGKPSRDQRDDDDED